MKLLLFTDIPPSTNFTGGIYLANLLSALPVENISCFNLLNPIFSPEIPQAYTGMPMQVFNKPREDRGNSRIGFILSPLYESYNSTIIYPKILDAIAHFAEKMQPTAMLVSLQGQSMIRLARPAAHRLGIPLYSMIYDPPGWWMRAFKVNRFTARTVLNEFGAVLRESVQVFTASWAMSEFYDRTYGIHSTPLLPSLAQEIARPPADEPVSKNEFSLCMAGQLYAKEEWKALLGALHELNWTLNGKKVKIRLLAPYVELLADGKPANIEFLGWRPQEETIRIFEQTDLLYCPYWLNPEFSMESRLSFPSKLSAYLASGRPVFFHGPEDSSPGKFLKEHDAALMCHTHNTAEIIRLLQGIDSDTARYAQLAHNGRKAFDQHFTMENLHSVVRSAMGCDDRMVNPPQL